MTAKFATNKYAAVAEWSKALRSGRNLFGGVGSNPTCSKENTFAFAGVHSFLLLASKFPLVSSSPKSTDCVHDLDP